MPKVVVVEANSEYLLLLQVLLRSKMGIEVVIAETCQRAIELLTSDLDIAYVISDVISDESGASLSDYLAAEPAPKVKLIHFTDFGPDPRNRGKTVLKTELEKLLFELE
ncbi:MAG: hypothetical protein V4692_08135 [Bdellovibrionota bacterium]